jgi:hypothetical protein
MSKVNKSTKKSNNPYLGGAQGFESIGNSGISEIKAKEPIETMDIVKENPLKENIGRSLSEPHELETIRKSIGGDLNSVDSKGLRTIQ